MKTAKKFDCVKMKDEAQRRRAERLRGFSAQARLEFYRQAHEALVRRQRELQAVEASSALPEPGIGSALPEE